MPLVHAGSYPTQALLALATQNQAATAAVNTSTNTSGAQPGQVNSSLQLQASNDWVKRFNFNAAGNTATGTAGNTALNQQVSTLSQQVLSLINQPSQQNQQQGQVNGQQAVPNNLSTSVSLNALDQNLQNWSQAAASGHYSYTLTQRGSFDDPDRSRPVNVAVSGGQISGASYSDNTPVSDAVLNTLPTVEQMFDNIRAAAGSGERADVLYDRSLGFPAFVFLGNEPASSADDVSYTFSNMSVSA